MRMGKKKGIMIIYRLSFSSQRLCEAVISLPLVPHHTHTHTHTHTHHTRKMSNHPVGRRVQFGRWTADELAPFHIVYQVRSIAHRSSLSSSLPFYHLSHTYTHTHTYTANPNAANQTETYVMRVLAHSLTHVDSAAHHPTNRFPVHR